MYPMLTALALALSPLPPEVVLMVGPPPPPQTEDDRLRAHAFREEARRQGLTPGQLSAEHYLDGLKAQMKGRRSGQLLTALRDGLKSQREFLRLARQGEVDTTLDELAQVELRARYLEALVEDDALRTAFARGDRTVFARLRQRIPGTGEPPDVSRGGDLPSADAGTGEKK